MVRVFMPVFSQEARGWLGGYIYSVRGVVHHPYPYGILPKTMILSNYYNVAGWYYQRRRTWHGNIWAAVRGHTKNITDTPYRIAQMQVFTDAVLAWQAFSQAEKDVYNKWRYPVKASGYNRFISWYYKLHPPVPAVGGYILQETSDKILTEASEALIQE